MEIQSKKRANLISLEGLLGHLADTMIGVENGTVNIEKAKTQALLVQQARNLLKDQLDTAKFLKQHGQPMTPKPIAAPEPDDEDEDIDDDGEELRQYEEAKKKIKDTTWTDAT